MIIVDDEKIKVEQCKRLIELRNQRGLSQQQVATLANIGLTTYNHMESGKVKTNFKFDMITKIAKALNSTPEYILFGRPATDRKDTIKGPDQEPIQESGTPRDSVETSLLQTDLFKSILEIDDTSFLSKIYTYISEQKEILSMKKELVRLSRDKKAEPDSSQQDTTKELIVTAKKRGRKRKTEPIPSTPATGDDGVNTSTLSILSISPDVEKVVEDISVVRAKRGRKKKSESIPPESEAAKDAIDASLETKEAE
jgi:transcriptional regulator with XRE-family HTH domain